MTRGNVQIVIGGTGAECASLVKLLPSPAELLLPRKHDGAARRSALRLAGLGRDELRRQAGCQSRRRRSKPASEALSVLSHASHLSLASTG
jgi:hypothetical protein